MEPLRYVDRTNRTHFGVTVELPRDPYSVAAEAIHPDSLRWSGDPASWAAERAGLELWSKQREILEALRDHTRVAVHSCHSTGKGLALDTPLPTPTGWTTMGEVQVGDLLLDEEGQPCRVVTTSPVRELDCYEVSFTSGETLTCDGDHLWSLVPSSMRRPRVVDWRDAWDRAKTLSVRELDLSERYRLPITRPLRGHETDLPVHPYLLGAWLGDGPKHALGLGIAAEDGEIVDRCERLSGWKVSRYHREPRREGYKPQLYATFQRGHGAEILRSLGVWTDVGQPTQKRIPAVYLRASVDARHELLAGLMDTDGSVGARGYGTCIGLTCEPLARDVFELIVSLGIKASFSHARKYVRQISRHVDVWTVQLSPTSNPFRLRRKVERWERARRLHPSRQTSYRIRSVEAVITVPTRCLTVDSPRSLYLAGRSMLPTHNTFDAATATAWWLDVHPRGEAFVVTTAPTGAQVKAILWREITRLHTRVGLPGRTNLTEWYMGNELVALGRKPSEHTEAGFQGIHAKYVLVILDEASGVPVELWNATESIASNRYSRVLAIGNPDTRDGEFFRVCDSASEWHVIHVGYEHTPNFTGEVVSESLRDLLISEEWVEMRRTAWGEKSALFQAKCLGVFPDPDSDPWKVIPYDMATRCRFLELPEDEPAEAGIDVGAGGDRTVIFERRGDRAGRVDEFRNPDPVATVGQLVHRINEWGIERVKVDVIGVGWNVWGRLRELSWRHNPAGERAHGAEVVKVNFAERASQPRRFLNRRAEVWWMARERSRLGSWDLSQVDDDTIAELVEPRYEILDSFGKIKIEAKDEVKTRLDGRSPDRADALLLAFTDAAGTGILDVSATDVFRRQPALLGAQRKPAVLAAAGMDGGGTGTGNSPFGARRVPTAYGPPGSTRKPW